MAGTSAVQTSDGVDSWALQRGDPVAVGGYRLVARLGSGGMADVFHAVAPTGDQVAVKVLRGHSSAAADCRREYEMLRTVDPSCTAPSRDHGMSAAGPYLVTTMLPGYRCATTLTARPTPPDRLGRYGAALARVLASVHARGVVHCDVKPANLLVRGDDIRLIDFGIARYAGEPGPELGVVQCSRGWAAPEQLRGERATPASDVFAWGCLMVFLATGRHPFASRDDQEWILRVQSAEPDLSGASPALHTIAQQCLLRDPCRRPTAGDLAALSVRT